MDGIGSSYSEDDNVSLNDCRVRNYEEFAGIHDGLSKKGTSHKSYIDIEKIVRHYVRVMYDRASETDLKRLIRKEMKKLKQLGII